MIDLLNISGGVMLLLFGVRYLRKALDRLFGPRLGLWLKRLVARPGWAFLAGLGVSVVAPSSTTISLLAVQTIQTTRLTARQMLVMMLGANIGLTAMVLLIGLRIEHYAPIFILIGGALFMYFQKSRVRGAGQFILAFGFLFLGIDIMRRAAEAGVAGGMGMDGVINFQELHNHIILLAVVAAVLTMILQSSTAAIALAIGLGAADAVTFRFTIPVVIGANVGMACTTLIVAWRTHEARRLATANLLLKCVVAVLGLIVLTLLGDKLPEPGVKYLSFATVAVHTGFNIIVAAIGLPLVPVVMHIVNTLMPTPHEGLHKQFGPKYINGGASGSVALALGQSLHEILHMSEIIGGMLTDTWRALKADDEQLAEAVSARDDKADLLEAAIKEFLTRLVKEEQDEDDADEQMRQLRYVSELETIGDIIDKNLCQLIIKKVRLAVSFSKEGEKELDDFYSRVAHNFTIAQTAFTTRDPQLAQQLMRNKEQLNTYENELRDRHFARLNAGMVESHETSAIHLDLLTHLKRINSSLSHVAYSILRVRPTPRPAASP